MTSWYFILLLLAFAFNTTSGINNLHDIDLLNDTQHLLSKISGAATGDQFGYSVTGGFDINGDGIGDIVIGARHGSPLSRYRAGAVYVIFGSQNTSIIMDIDLANNATLMDGNRGFQIFGTSTGNFFGFSVDGSFDINGDGVDDILVGARYASPQLRSSAGAAYVIFGNRDASVLRDIDLVNNSTLMNGNRGFQIFGARAGDEFGFSVSGGFDVNGDGLGDIIIGAPYADPQSRSNLGAAYVIFGSRNASDLTDIDLANNYTLMNDTRGFQVLGAVTNGELGFSVGSSDINGDSVDDVIIGAHMVSSQSRFQAGATYVIFGNRNTSLLRDLNLANNATLMNGNLGFQILGAMPGDDFGSSISGSFDVNGDGVEDIVIGARYASPPNRIQAGAAYVIFGSRNTSVLTDMDLANNATLMNGQRGFQILGAMGGAWLGFSSGGGLDINGDDADDIIIGARYASPLNRFQAGAAYVIFGSRNASILMDMDLINNATLMNGQRGFQILGAITGDTLSTSVRGSCNMNNDDVVSIIIGVPYADPQNRSNAGAAYLLSFPIFSRYLK